MNWFALAKVAQSFGTSPGPASGITYKVRYNDPNVGTPVETPPLRPWNPLEFDPNGDEMFVYALPVGSPMLAISVEGIVHFVALGPAEPRAYVECGNGAARPQLQPPPTVRDPLPPLPPLPPRITPNSTGVTTTSGSAPDGGGIGE